MAKRDAHLSDETPDLKERGKGEGVDKITISDLMTGDFERILPDTPIAHCITHFSQKGCRDLVVVDQEDRFLGIVTPVDLITQLIPTIGVRSRKKSGCIECIIRGDASTAEDIMSRKHITVYEDTPVEEALRLLEKYHHPDLVVVDRGGVVIGVVEICTIIAHLKVSGRI
ncbi:MAG: CBS domain protein [Methanoregulaceae archaeon PtaB.Bin056]|jgi:predicted transcriptional regulator|nr:MAG: CBS domain protein [Methanoregulaceae archaeon PtaB.Bin056]